MSKERGRPPKDADKKMGFYDYVRLTEAQYNKVTRIAEHLGGVSRAAVFRYLLEKEES